MANTCHGAQEETIFRDSSVRRAGGQVLRQSSHPILRDQGEDKLSLQQGIDCFLPKAKTNP